MGAQPPTQRLNRGVHATTIMAGDIVVFGFGPFGDYAENPSEIICGRLDGRMIGDYRVYAKVLPVEYGGLEESILEVLGGGRPKLVLGLGLAAGRTHICLERVAVNYRDTHLADRAGFRPTSRIDPEGPVAVESNLPVEEIVGALRRAGIPAKVSLSAGAYLCNNMMYIVCREASRRGFLGGFVHLPCHEELASRLEREVASMSLATMQRAVEMVAHTALATLRAA